jgi:hypothetical protein
VLNLGLGKFAFKAGYYFLVEVGLIPIIYRKSRSTLLKDYFFSSDFDVGASMKLDQFSKTSLFGEEI